MLNIKTFFKHQQNICYKFAYVFLKFRLLKVSIEKQYKAKSTTKKFSKHKQNLIFKGVPVPLLTEN